MKFATGFYILRDSHGNSRLVKVYIDSDNNKYIGFGEWDGGGKVTINQLPDDSILTSIEINELQ